MTGDTHTLMQRGSQRMFKWGHSVRLFTHLRLLDTQAEGLERRSGQKRDELGFSGVTNLSSTLYQSLTLQLKSTSNHKKIRQICFSSDKDEREREKKQQTKDKNILHTKIRTNLRWQQQHYNKQTVLLPFLTDSGWLCPSSFWFPSSLFFFKPAF